MDRDYAGPLDVPALARAALMSPGHFLRSFRAAFGETPYSYLRTRRIERAKALFVVVAGAGRETFAVLPSRCESEPVNAVVSDRFRQMVADIGLPGCISTTCGMPNIWVPRPACPQRT
ncbi:MAG: helix-turn-helix domain-containing protein [Haloechinothrix sp.]